MSILDSDCFKEHEGSSDSNNINVDEGGEVVRPEPSGANSREYLQAQLNMITRLGTDTNQQQPTALPPLADRTGELSFDGEIIASNFEKFLRTRRRDDDGLELARSHYFISLDHP